MKKVNERVTTGLLTLLCELELTKILKYSPINIVTLH